MTKIAYKTMYTLRRSHTVRPAVAVLLVLLFAGCTTSGVNRGDFNLVSLEEEWQLGRQLEAEIGRQMKLVKDPVAVNYINQIGQRIVAKTEMARLPWKFHIVDDPSINAFNIPGGHVYVNTGLIRAADNVAELAGVMAHEISHGVSRHGTERLSKTYGLSIAAGALLGGNPGIIQQIVAQIAATGAVAKFSRDDERESDRLGIRYMYEAGYDPNGMASMFEELLAEGRRRPSSLEQFFSTHPLTQDRIRDAQKQAAQYPRRNIVTKDNTLPSIQQRVR